ncbi:MAG TPA: sulfocyanin-like copper-binding protein [Thermoplasmata archaeon]|nr:sulfocyanin-like copper-binding protein [Thermoplasmata archaeon]
MVVGAREEVTVAAFRRPARAWRRGAPWIAVGLVLAVLAASGGARGVPFLTYHEWVGHARPLGGPANLTIVMYLNDTPSFSPRFITAAPDQNVSIQLMNTGVNAHSFTLASQSGLPVNRTETPAALNRSFATHPPLVNVSAPAMTSTHWANFTVASNASFDSFLFVSQVPYQYQAGMWGYLNISSNVPGLSLSDNTTSSFAFQPSALAADPAHFPANFAIEVTNLGTLGHTFTLVGQPGVNITTVGYFQSNSPLVNVTIPAEAGKSGFGNFTLMAAGVYEYVCTVQGHFQNGMFGYLYAGVPVPPGPAPLSTAIVDAWILGGSAALLGIGLLFVVVAGFTGRFPGSPPSGHGGH